MTTLDPNLLKQLVEASPEGVALCEPGENGWQVVFVNPAMEALTGYRAEQLRGQDLRLLQADDKDQDGVAKIRQALADGNACQALIRNYRPDGTLFWNDVKLVPMRSATGELTHFASFHREGGVLRSDARTEGRDPAMTTQTMLAYLRDDKLTGLLRRQYFEDLVKRDWALAQRESRRLSFLVFDLDCYRAYRDVFGRQGADQSFRRIARVIGGCFRRASDLCGRYDEDQIATLTTGLDLAQAAKLAEAVLGRVRDLAIHHPRSAVSRYVTASVGVVSVVPPHDMAPERLYEAALKALQDAKDLGRNRVVSREWE